MSVQSPLTNLHLALGWLTIFNIRCHMKGTNLDSTGQCLVVHLPGSLIRSICIFCICATQTSKSFHQISLLLRRPQSRHSLMALSALAFHTNNTELCAVRDLALNLSKINNKTLANVNHNYHGPLRQSLIFVENDMLILHKPIVGTSSFTRLQLAPSELMNIIFIAFHTNPIGGHLNVYRKFHRIWLRFYWPGMYSNVKRMCQACPGCALANPTCSKSSELVYNFPIEAPFLVMFFDAYSAGNTPVLRVPTATWLVVVECAVLPAWSQSPEPQQPLLPVLSCASYFDSDLATQLSWIKTASSLKSVARQLIYSWLIVTSYPVQTTTLWSSNESIDTSRKV